MKRPIRFRAWIKKDARMEPQVCVDPFRVTDLDRLRWNHEEVEVMQFIGLQDKNGKDIYEGDIVFVKRDKFGEGKHEYWTVEYEEAAFIVFNQLNSNRKIEAYMGEADSPYFSPDGDEICVLEVTGNIYENADLFK